MSAAHLSEVYCMEQLMTNNTGLSLVLLAELLQLDKKKRVTGIVRQKLKTTQSSEVVYNSFLE